MICVKCTATNPPTARFCTTCGEAMTHGGSGDTETGSGMTRGLDAGEGATTALVPGTVLSGRYRIVEAIGIGGMGAVYKAVDLELEVPVALKVIRSEYAGNPKILERFKKEITIARKITHKNVARIYDLGESGGSRFISMEYIQGRDLASIIEKDGAIPVDKVLAIMRQCCSALAEAHAMGVVHRDLKPHNVMLDARGDVKLMDFGIAMSQETKGLTRTGAIVGTPEYMSPEQAEGKKVDLRADIYSFGITLYEALTGTVPFSGRTQWEIIRRQIEDKAKPPRRLRAEIPVWLEAIVLKCLEKSPAHRYQSVAEIVRDIEHQQATRVAVASAPKSRKILWAVGAAGLVAAAIGVSLWLWPRGPAAGPGGRTSVAVLSFSNQTGRADLDWLRTGLAENLTTDLGQSKYVRVVTRERVGQILRDLGLSERSDLDAGALARIAEFGGVQALVNGSFVASGRDLRVDLRVLDRRTGKRIGSAGVTGRDSEVLSMIDELTLRTKEILELGREKIAGDADSTIATARTYSIKAASLFQSGIDLMDQGQHLEAIAPLEEATREDPDFALAWARLSQAYRAAGYDDKAKDAGDRALSKVLKVIDQITPADRAFVRANHAVSSNDPQEAIEAYDEMLRVDPYDATAAYDLGIAYESHGEWANAEKAFREALRLDANYAPAYISIGRIKVRAGRPEASLPEFQGALELYRKFGSREGEAAAYQAIGNAHVEVRNWREASEYFAKSALIREGIGDRKGQAASLVSQGSVLQATGRLAEAEKAVRAALGIRRELGDSRGVAIALTTLGGILEDEGDLPGSLEARGEALGMWRSLGDRTYEAKVLQEMGSARILSGDLDLSEGDLRPAAEIYREMGDAEGTAQVTSDLGVLALEKGDPSRAEALLADAMQAWTSLGSAVGIPETQLRQARVALALGRQAEAERLARLALAGYEKAEEKLDVVRCRTILARALDRLGKRDEAVGLLDAALSEARGLGNRILLAEVEAARSSAAKPSAP